MPIKPSELVLNADGSIYHLNLLPEEIADTVLLVGDPNRVARISRHFDTLEIQKTRREFVTHTGTLRGKRLTALSTGIGTDNIDIVLNELDALVNIDFQTREINSDLRALNLIRVGTSGSIQEAISVDEMVGSHYAIGFDNVIHYYKNANIRETKIENAFRTAVPWPEAFSDPYVIKADAELVAVFEDDRLRPGFTGTNVGFYGPQGRELRLSSRMQELSASISEFNFKGLRITNFEMESSAIYALAAMLGHKAYSLNCILANRVTGEFSASPAEAVDTLIEFTLDKLCPR